MQKLEEILRAEEAARHATADARETAEGRVREAEAEARRIVEEARGEAARQAAELRKVAQSEAAVRATRIETDAVGSLERTLAGARGRMDAAVLAAVRELVG